MGDQRTTPASVRDRVVNALRTVPDFPTAGILFKDITPVLSDADLLADLTSALAAPWLSAGITHVVGIESRGFILGTPVAIALGAGFIPVRKPGKLPWRTISRAFALEYGADRLEIHADACPEGSRLLVVDDVLATGGTAEAACFLVEQSGGIVAGCSFLLTIPALGGRARLMGRRVESLLDDA